MSDALRTSPQSGARCREEEQAAARAALYKPPRISLLVPAIAVACLTILYLAWRVREDMYLHAGRDIGYALGVAGLGMMILLLGYPLRKHVRALASLGPLPLWFHVHMILGVLGPVAVLLHCNFELGSINSSVALISTLLVGTSGFVGRFAYTRIHYGLFGRREHLAEIKEQMDALRESALARAPGLAKELDFFGAWVSSGNDGMSSALSRFFGVGRRVRRLRRLIRRAAGSREMGTLQGVLESYLRAGRRVAQIGVYERVFSLWHAFHLPISFFLYGAAIVHVVAVHLY